jgi:hypothetical protein
LHGRIEPVFAFVLALARKLNDEDRVFGGEPDEHDKPDLRQYVDVHPAQQKAAHRGKQARPAGAMSAPELPPKGDCRLSGVCDCGRVPRPCRQNDAAKRLMITAALGIAGDVAGPSNGPAAASRTSMTSERSRMPSDSRRFSNSTITPQLANAKSSIRASPLPPQLD